MTSKYFYMTDWIMTEIKPEITYEKLAREVENSLMRNSFLSEKKRFWELDEKRCVKFFWREKSHCLFSFQRLSNCFSFALSFTLNNRHDSSSAYRRWSRLIVGSSLLETSYRRLIVFETDETVKQHCNKPFSWYWCCGISTFSRKQRKRNIWSKNHFVPITVLFRRSKRISFVFGRSKKNTIYWNKNIQRHFLAVEKNDCITHSCVLPLKVEFVAVERKKATISKSVLYFSIEI